ncbi:MAG: pilus assembly protein PilM, partial [candidate division KSB1 bacterium]|nr:pilus assembly protein PilM [candidate division KSB1 bacterium]
MAGPLGTEATPVWRKGEATPMISAAKQGMIGISIRDTALRMVEAVKIGDECRISKLTQARVHAPFHILALKDRITIRRFAEEINRLYDTSDFSVASSVFILDAQSVLIKKIPVDGNLQGERLKDHVRWEVGQCIISEVGDYIVDHYRLPPKNGHEYTDVVVGAVRRVAVDFLKEMFSNTDLKLQAIDVDIFAAQRVFSANYETHADEHAALIDVRNSSLQISILKGNEFFLAHDLEYQIEPENDFTRRDHDYVARLISKELRRLIIDHKLGKSVEDMAAIYLYGDHVTDQLLETLQNTHNVRIDRVNPFRKIKMTSPGSEILS